MYWNNGAADPVARLTNLQRPPEFWKLWEENMQQVHGTAKLHAQVWNLHVAVARRSVGTEKSQTLDDVAVKPPNETRVFQLAFGTTKPSSFANEYGACRTCGEDRYLVDAKDSGTARYTSPVDGDVPAL